MSALAPFTNRRDAPKKPLMASRSYPVDRLFSRQRVVELTGIADDVLGYWMREGVLVSSHGVGRTHRRFGYLQLHVAVVLNELRRYGVSIEGLRRLANVLQRSIVAGEHAAAPSWGALLEARQLAGLGEMKAEGALFVGADGKLTSEAPESVVATAARISNLPASEASLLPIYLDLISTEHLAKPANDDGWMWEIAAHEDRDWQIFGSIERPAERQVLTRLSGFISVNLTLLIHRLWVRSDGIAA